MASAILTPEARRHVLRMIGAIGPAVQRLDRQFTRLLKERPYDAAQIRAFLAITPAAAARLGSLRPFLEQVEHNGRRLAKLNVPPAEVEEVLRGFGGLLDALLDGKFQPAREQLQLATTLTLNQAYYQVREAESQAFFGIYRAEAEAEGLDELLRRFVRILTQTFHARAGRLVLQPPQGKLARPLYIERGRTGERLIADGGMRGRYASYWSYPLHPVGVVQFGFPAPNHWLPRELALLESAAGRCREALERTRMEAEIRRLEAQSRDAEEQERRRIGRELHDEAGQSLLLLRLQLEMMERDAAPEFRPRLAEARGIAERTVADLRRVIAALSPAVLDRLGLERALRQLAARFQKMHAAKLRLTIPAGAGAVSPQIQEVIYRVAQESLQNIAKHSQATHVNLSLRTADHFVRLSVSDDGAGYCAETAEKKPMSFGLTGMRERAALLGGTLALRSAPGKGASVVLQLPRNSALEAPNGKDSRVSH
jgi:signal transduction histidine kinase